MICNLYLVDMYDDESIEFNISTEWPYFDLINSDIQRNLLENGEYTMKSFVNKESVQLILDYLQNREIPEIDESNKFDLNYLCNEFGILTNEIQENINISFLNDVKNLQQPPNSNTPNLIEKVAQNLDQYIIECGDELLKVPIQSLNMIFNLSKRFTKHNLCYYLILQHSKCFNDKDIFILLPYLDGSQIDPKNLDDAIFNSKSRYGFLPNIEFNFISEMNDKFEQFQNEQKKINEKFIDELSNHNDLLNEIKNTEQNFEKQLLRQKQYDEERIKELENEIQSLKEKYQ